MTTYRNLLQDADQPIHKLGKPSFEGENQLSTSTCPWPIVDVTYDQFPRGLSRWPNMVDELICLLREYANSEQFLRDFPAADEEISMDLSLALQIPFLSIRKEKCKCEKDVQKHAGELMVTAIHWLQGASRTGYMELNPTFDEKDKRQPKVDRLEADRCLVDDNNMHLYIDCKTRVVLGAHSGYEDQLKTSLVDHFTREPTQKYATGYQSMFGKVRALTLPGWGLV